MSLFPFPKANTKHLRHYVLGVNVDDAAVPKSKKESTVGHSATSGTFLIGVEQKPLVRISSAWCSLSNIEGRKRGHTRSCNRYRKPLLFHPLGDGFAVDFVGICATSPLKGTPFRV